MTSDSFMTAIKALERHIDVDDAYGISVILNTSDCFAGAWAPVPAGSKRPEVISLEQPNEIPIYINVASIVSLTIESEEESTMQ